MVRDGIGGMRASLLALGVGFWAGLQTVPPILALLHAKSASAGPAGDPGGLTAGLGVAFLASANPVQIALWLLAGPLYALAALSLAGVRLGPARDYYGVALLLEAVVWAMFRRGFAYLLLPALVRLALFGLAALLVFGYLLVLSWETADRSNPAPPNPSRRSD